MSAESERRWDYAYDAANNLLTVTDPLGHVTTYAYDSLNRKTSETDADPDGAGSLTSPVTSYTNDVAGNLLTITDPSGNVTTYAYDNLSRKISETDADPDGAGTLTSPVISYTYDAANNLLTVPAGTPDLVRFYNPGAGSRLSGPWMTRGATVQGMTASTVESGLSLPWRPTNIADAIVGGPTPVKIGQAGPQFGQTGGLHQYQLTTYPNSVDFVPRATPALAPASSLAH